MLGWAIAIVLGIAAGTALGMAIRREKSLHAWLSGEVAGLHADISQAREELRSLSSPQTGDMLDRVEVDDFEIAGNLDRMNALLDQLHGLLKGKSVEDVEIRRMKSHFGEPVIFSGQLDFTSPEELLKFSNLPPISEEEIRTIDWESFLRGIAAEGTE